jgi:SagB-type dehydrogenase family enzyme
MNSDPLFSFLSGDSDSILDQLHRRRSAYKKYTRFPEILLPTPDHIATGVSDVLQKRKSIREYSDEPLSQKYISNILFWSAGLLEKRGDNQLSRRAHPSGGALYPIELYPIILRGENIPRGVYHYNIEKHTLEHILTANLDDAVLTFDEYGSYADIIAQSGMTIILSFMKNRSMGKYKEFAYKLAFLEGGHIGQNLCMLSSALSLGSCSFALRKGFSLNEAIGLDGVHEAAFYAVSVGCKKR